ncbi:MAG: S16 family serine protease, partial [Chloroflexales bacterium]
LLSPPLLLLPVPYGLYAPGGAVSVAPMVDAPGIPPTPTRGALLLTTIIEQTPIVVAQWLAGQFDPAITLMPPERLVPQASSPQALVAESATQLSESQVTAALVALRLAGYPAALTGDGARVLAAPAGALLRPGDRIVALGGATVKTAPDLLAALAGRAARDLVAAVVVRDEQTLHLQLPLLAPAAPGGPPRLGVTVETANQAVASPVQILLHPQGIIGGPSAGLMFTLAIYDRLTPGDLTGGRRIAGTGTVSLDGQVGPIGGVAQKVAAAERSGAEIFLVPQENAAEAQRAARRITIIAVGSAAEALAALQRLPPAGAALGWQRTAPSQ